MIEHAKYELDLILKQCGDDEEGRRMQEVINKNILDIVELFANQHHSGMTAEYVINILIRLLKQSFITPLTGEDDEWVEVMEGMYQNKRESTIFKDKDVYDGKPYYIEGKVFSDDGGKTWFTNGNSNVLVDFPLEELPKTEYVILGTKEGRSE